MEKFSAMLSRTPAPVTVDRLAGDLRSLGVLPGMTLIVHSSLSAFGWVCGGAPAVILALLEAVGKEGTIVMPTQSSTNSEPRNWRNPPIPESWWETVRQSMPPYRPDLTPSGGMGRVPEAFRKMDGVERSSHPKVSFAACGPNAAHILEGHSLAFPLGEGSPLARLYELDAHVLLLGVDYERCTALHLAEFRGEYPGKKIIREGASVLVEGRQCWVEYDDVDEEDDFGKIGVAFELETNRAVLGSVAQAQSRLVPVRPLVDFAVRWMEENRREV